MHARSRGARGGRGGGRTEPAHPAVLRAGPQPPGRLQPQLPHRGGHRLPVDATCDCRAPRHPAARGAPAWAWGGHAPQSPGSSGSHQMGRGRLRLPPGQGPPACNAGLCSSLPPARPRGWAHVRLPTLRRPAPNGAQPWGPPVARTWEGAGSRQRVARAAQTQGQRHHSTCLSRETRWCPDVTVHSAGRAAGAVNAGPSPHPSPEPLFGSAEKACWHSARSRRGAGALSGPGGGDVPRLLRCAC